jgi:hypothetical protein
MCGSFVVLPTLENFHPKKKTEIQYFKTCILRFWRIGWNICVCVCVCVGGVSGVVALCVLTHITHRLKRERRGGVDCGWYSTKSQNGKCLSASVYVHIYMIHTHWWDNNGARCGADQWRGALSRLAIRFTSRQWSDEFVCYVCVWVEWAEATNTHTFAYSRINGCGAPLVLS